MRSVRGSFRCFLGYGVIHMERIEATKEEEAEAETPDAVTADD
jgi:hypothetical protein